MIGFLTRFHYLTRILLNLLLCWMICKLWSSSGNQSLLSTKKGKKISYLLNENILLELKSSRRNCMYQNGKWILLNRQQSHVSWCLLWQTLMDGWCQLDRDQRHTWWLGLTPCSGGGRWGHVGLFWATESQSTWEQNKIVGSFTRNDTNKIFQWEINW